MNKYIGIFWTCFEAGWIEVKKVLWASSKEEAEKRAEELEDKNPGMVKFVGWDGEVE